MIYMKKYFIFAMFTLSLFAIALPRASFADPLWYGSLLSISGDTANLELRGLEDKNYFSCTISTLACNTLSSAPSTLNQTSTNTESFTAFPGSSTHQDTSPTGKFGFYTTISTIKKTRVLGLITKSNKKYSISDPLNFWNLLDEQPHVSRFAPDESTLTYLDDRSGFASLYAVNLKSLSQKSFQGTKITSGVSVGDFRYADSQTLLYVANTTADPYNWILYSYDFTTQTKKIVAQHLIYDTVLYQSGNAIIFTEITPLGTLPVVLTDYHGADVENFKVSIPTPKSINPITYTYQKIAGENTVVMTNRNSGATTHPLIIWLHGGPYRQGSFVRHPYISYGVYDWALEQAVGQGAYVVKIDYPGSYGAGRLFTESIRGGVGLTDVKGVENVITDFTNHNHVDGVYMMGNSYGGYLALRMAVAYPQTVSGALSVNGVTDWTSLLSFYKNSIFNTFFNGLPSSKNKTLFAKASIINRIPTLKNPLYIIQGDVDTTIPKSQATLLKNALDKANKTSTLIMIPKENHVFLKDSSINTICQTLFKMTNLDTSKSCNLSG